jgi:hypothetical protein
VTIIPPEPDVQSVVIKFEGICVNFSRLNFPLLPTAHRIVLINATTITDVWGNLIDPHMAGFSTGSDTTGLPSGDPAGEIPLQGATVKIAKPITTGSQTGVTYDASYKDIPSLTTLTPGATPVSLAVLFGQNPALVACYFDVDFGTISSACSPLGATMTVVTILTDGPPQYQIEPFVTALSSLSSPSPLKAALLPATNSMFFWNEEQSFAGASKNDFLLSYLVVDPPPVSPTIPTIACIGPATPNRKSTLAGKSGVEGMLVDLGCSNSAYP